MRFISGDFDCIFFTSALPAKIIAPRLRDLPRVIAIGPQTAKELRQYHIDCEILTSFYSRDFVPYLGEWIRGRQIGIPRADCPESGSYGSDHCGWRGFPWSSGVMGLSQLVDPLDLAEAEAILFTSAMSFQKAIWIVPTGSSHHGNREDHCGSDVHRGDGIRQSWATDHWREPSMH